MTRFTPTPAPPDKPLFIAAVLVSLAVHIALLLSLIDNRLPRIPPWTPHALKVALLNQPATIAPPASSPQLLAEHNSLAGQAPKTPQPVTAAAAPTLPHPAAPAARRPAANPAIDAPAVLTREQARSSLPDSNGDNLPHNAQDWLGQARKLASQNNAGGDNRNEARAVFGVNATGVKWARYVEDWRMKIERIGKLNYPAEARSQNLFGSLELAVIIRADGSLQDVRILRSSGQDVLDQAALHIVRMAAPYAPFPPALAADFPSLEITRKWSFTTANQLSAN